LLTCMAHPHGVYITCMQRLLGSSQSWPARGRSGTHPTRAASQLTCRSCRRSCSG
jgi:hypothetical protein